MYGRMKLFLKRTSGQEPWLRPTIWPVLFQAGDWAVCPALLGRIKPVVYSLGIGDSIEFEALLVEEFDAEVHGFDPTLTGESLLQARNAPAGFHFHAWAVAAIDDTKQLYPRRRHNGTTIEGMYTCVRQASVGSDELSVISKRLSSIMFQLGHENIDVLKMDIEGAEYEVLEDLMETQVRPGQILVEFHHRFDGIDKNQTLELIGQLTRIGYEIAFVSSTGREVTFVYGPHRIARSVNRAKEQPGAP